MFNNLTLNEIYNQEELFANLVPGTGIVLIGRASSGPSMTPVRIVDTDHAARVFGEDSELSNAYVEAAEYGARQVYLIRTNGKHAYTNIQNYITLVSKEANNTAGKTKYQISAFGEEKYLSISNIDVPYDQTYYLNDRKISQLVSQINMDAITTDSPVYALMRNEADASVLVDELFSNAQTDGGATEEGLSPIQNLLDALDILTAYPISQVGILSNAYNEISDREYLYQKLVDFADEKARSGMPCIVTIGTNLSTMLDSTIYETANSFLTVLYTECQVSEYINVVLAKPRFDITFSTYQSNGVASYCGLIDSLPYYEGTTNSIIRSAIEDSISLTYTQKKELADKGYVVFTDMLNFIGKEVRVLKGANLTRSTNVVIDRLDSSTPLKRIATPLSKLSNVRLIQHILFSLNNDMDLENYDPLTTKKNISSILERESKYIKEYTIKEFESYQGFTKEYILYVEITPVGEVNGLSLSVRTR